RVLVPLLGGDCDGSEIEVMMGVVVAMDLRWIYKVVAMDLRWIYNGRGSGGCDRSELEVMWVWW
ncbi:hypothetical protein A2U01_0091863, partial [Trifolium medium]|nr:hypothetical protein [Trifolium medium]